MVAPRRGEIWWGEMPQAKGRPYLIVVRDAAVDRLSAILVAPVTTKIRGIPTECELGPDDGMLTECVASFDNLQTITKADLTRRIGALAPSRSWELCRALREVAGC